MEQIGKHFDVTGSLREVIHHFYCIRTPSDFQKISQHLSPNLEMMIAFNFGEPVRLSFGSDPLGDMQIDKVAVLGPLRKLLNYEIPADTDLIIAVFNLDGFYRLFQLPMDDLGTDKIIDPDKLLNITGFSDLWEMLKNLSSLSDRIELLKEYALAFIAEPEQATIPLVNGISYFHNPVTQPVKAIAADSELSERTIQMRFKKYVGYSPKELLRFLRFKQVIASIQEQEKKEVDWYSLVEKFGYHDQSHLIKDFNHYLGTTPQKFVKQILGEEFCVTKYDLKD